MALKTFRRHKLQVQVRMACQGRVGWAPMLLLATVKGRVQNQGRGGGKKLRAWKKIAYPPPHPPGVAYAKKSCRAIIVAFGKNFT